MDRRGFLLTVGAAVAAPVALRAQADDNVVSYYGRLQRGLQDAGGGRFLGRTEDLLLGEHNTIRADNGLPLLRRNVDLDAAARAHTADLLRRNYFDHRSPEGFRAGERVGLLARRFVGASGENIALQQGGLGAPSASELATMWWNSPGHRANMLRRDYTHVGFGVAAHGDRTMAGAVFGQTFAELLAPAPFHIGHGDILADILDGCTPRINGYELQPLGAGRSIGPFRAEQAPMELSPGAYTIRPHAPDPAVPYRYWVLYGPIVLAS